ncbi:hypothetical protein [Achromobacter arsenitoxydans]|uniref:Putative lipoprotein n=1 Tax=Achromobacter arsenitoxydans SY8 TaxID=477184 RepID=H0F8E7_9BURK|nr:hypothetical protein [Achromobacter arsenitoxydans]EHK65580.1 putative lipoprotein [Achromobacter arsenitoxydans SY8]
MKRLSLIFSTCLLAGCAGTVATQKDLATYGTPPSEDDLYQYMSSLRDTLPPTRYVSYRDKGYADSVKKATYTGEDGKPVSGWEYAFEVAGYDQVGPEQPQWTARRVVFFNGRAIGGFDGNGNFMRTGAQPPAASAPAPAAAPAQPR